MAERPHAQASFGSSAVVATGRPLARLVHDNLELRDTAYTIANEGRQVIECDRVSVAIKKGGSCKVIAISGQDTIESRSNIVAALNKLTSRVVAAGDPLWYDGSLEDLPPQLEEAIEDYVDLSHGRTVAVLPIRRPEKVVEGDVMSKQHVQREDITSREIIGALVIEQIESQLPPICCARVPTWCTSIRPARWPTR